MKIYLATLFPKSLESYFSTSILAKGLREGVFSLHVENIADHSVRSTRRADDRPFGGMPGTVIAPEPASAALEACQLLSKDDKIRWIAPDPRGKIVSQEFFESLSKDPSIGFICGHYEGIDERLFEEYQIEKVSLGNFILTGGEIAAGVMIDATVRLLPGLLSKESLHEESFSANLGGKKEYPHYTRPRVWRGKSVPPELLSGNHSVIEDWKKKNLQ